jgi:hypothetical protein
MNHLFKELRDVMGERYVLVTRFEPVKLTSFHEKVSTLLAEKIELLERIKLGISGESGR